MPESECWECEVRAVDEKVPESDAGSVKSGLWTRRCRKAMLGV